MSTFPPAATAGPEPAPPHVPILLPCFSEEEHVLLEIERICGAMDKSEMTRK